ncbi:hypothetical protein EDB19DRAFT_2036549 [Suillus lakei]|nr:hypothetical protein EDB19DRAFT_2036549 [Suillus lakei]
MGRRCSNLSMVSKVKEAILQPTGNLRTLRSNLTKLRADHLAFEREQAQSQLANNATARQLLAEAALKMGTTVNLSADIQYLDYPGMDFDMGREEDYVDEEDEPQDEEEASDGISRHEGSAVDVARAHVIYCLQGGHRCWPPCSRLQCNRQCHSAWRSQMPALIAGYLRWKDRDATPTSSVDIEAGTFAFHVSVVDILASTSLISVPQATDELANVSLVNIGLLGCSPLQPKIAVSFQCLELYHQIHQCKPSFSVQAMVKVLCALHNRSYFQALQDQFAIAFDAYLDILRGVRELADIVLKCDSPHWRMLHSCPACNYKQENEPALIPARMDSMDGNSSLKQVDGSGHADEQIFKSSYLIPPDEVDVFKDDVRLQPGTRAAITHTAGGTTPGDTSESACTDNWKTANTISDNTVKVFKQTGIFISACQHGMIQTLVEMRRSGELAKYALATTNKVLNVYALSPPRHTPTIIASLSTHFMDTLTTADVNFGSILYINMASVLKTSKHASTYFQVQMLYLLSFVMHLTFTGFNSSTFTFSNEILIGKFLYNNYKQVLTIIDDLSPAVEELKLALKISDGDFERWNMEELEFLESLAEEQEGDIEAMTYVDTLQSLAKAEAAYGSVTTVQFLTYTPADFTPSHGLQKNQQAFARAREAERHAAHRKLVLEMNVVDDIEHCMGITERWHPQDVKYQEGLAYLTNRQFIQAVEHLQGLIIQRLFELAKANIAGTGYKLCQHILSAISRQSAAIRTALEKYNQLAIIQTPPQEVLDFSKVASYAWLGKFDLLKHSHHHILEKPWASKGNQEVANNFFKIQHAHEEVQHLNVEVTQLSACLALSHEISHMYEERK